MGIHTVLLTVQRELRDRPQVASAGTLFFDCAAVRFADGCFAQDDNRNVIFVER